MILGVDFDDFGCTSDNFGYSRVVAFKLKEFLKLYTKLTAVTLTDMTLLNLTAVTLTL